MPKKGLDASRMRIWQVEHPELPAATVTAEDGTLAGVAAAKAWGRPWREVAAYIDVKSLGVAYKLRCPSCGREFYAVSAAEKYQRCPPCKKRHDAGKARIAREAWERKKRER